MQRLKEKEMAKAQEEEEFPNTHPSLLSQEGTGVTDLWELPVLYSSVIKYLTHSQKV